MQPLDVCQLDPNPQRRLPLPRAIVQPAQRAGRPRALQSRFHLFPAGGDAGVVWHVQQVQVEADGRSVLLRFDQLGRDEREVHALVEQLKQGRWHPPVRLPRGRACLALDEGELGSALLEAAFLADGDEAPVEGDAEKPLVRLHKSASEAFS